MKGETSISKTVLEHTAFASKDSIDQWLRRNVPDDVTDVGSYLKGKTIDHTIPCNAFTFKIEDGSVVRCFDVSIEDQKRLWHPDNMTLMDSLQNSRKKASLPNADTLSRIKHCWPSWWNGVVPSVALQRQMSLMCHNN